MNTATAEIGVVKMKKQSGAVLIIGLIMLLLMTIVGLAAIRGSGMQELMAGNTRDRNLAFQAAEAGLRVAESVNTDALPFDGTLGSFPDLNQSDVTWERVHLWSADDWANDAADSALDFSPTVPSAPRYAIERIVMPVGAVERVEGSDISFNPGGSGASLPEPEYFRATSRGTGGSTNTEVVLQTMIKRLELSN